MHDIRWIRDKFDDDPSTPPYLTSVRGFGYRLGSARGNFRCGWVMPRSSWVNRYSLEAFASLSINFSNKKKSSGYFLLGY